MRLRASKELIDKIYNYVSQGYIIPEITRMLVDEGIKTPTGLDFNDSSVAYYVSSRNMIKKLHKLEFIEKKNNEDGMNISKIDKIKRVLELNLSKDLTVNVIKELL